MPERTRITSHRRKGGVPTRARLGSRFDVPTLLGKKLDRDEHQDGGEDEAVLPAAETALWPLSRVWPTETRYTSDIYTPLGQDGRGVGGADPVPKLTWGENPHTCPSKKPETPLPQCPVCPTWP